MAKIVLITGANGGLGTPVTRGFLDSGASVIGVSRNIAQAEFDHSQFHATAAEISSLDSARRIAESAVARFGRIDALVHTVGGFAGGKPVEETDDATWRRMFDINLDAAFHITRAVLPHMRRARAGRIIGVGSRAAVDPGPNLAAYNASKAALVSLFRTIALENRELGITANVVLPGTMDTPANRRDMPNADFSKWVPTAHVAQVILFLASDAAAEITGAAIPIFGPDL